ncbi:hypothetical protein TTHERM_000264768 (macronuclear) [Tetrahymena thermophila SB210]|uniref:Uncharacterized protein n=1 Tax=Tetrahymena thermophila (strain SB210) TaxID=312017 RepID=W7XGJ7_TETTS|nr:hypothetical protein TTHERM_000264768 [Tetrahymena thermophila SB210]EWS76123.1 hypothetical protein TTHERM_000264768 [Tetrahymena thermophila SB210]|eukprot:XP_012651363.1 hypothetical protein TTHERM_000264768 [Tetrahymena thermophila SB210]
MDVNNFISQQTQLSGYSLLTKSFKITKKKNSMIIQGIILQYIKKFKLMNILCFSISTNKIKINPKQRQSKPAKILLQPSLHPITPVAIFSKNKTMVKQKVQQVEQKLPQYFTNKKATKIVQIIKGQQINEHQNSYFYFYISINLEKIRLLIQINMLTEKYLRIKTKIDKQFQINFFWIINRRKQDFQYKSICRLKKVIQNKIKLFISNSYPTKQQNINLLIKISALLFLINY